MVMSKNIIEKNVRVATVWFLIWNMLLFGITCVMTCVVAPFAYNAICGPFEISWEELERLQQDFTENTERGLVTKRGVNLLGFVTLDYKSYFLLEDSYEFDLMENSDYERVGGYTVYDFGRYICITNGNKVLCTNFSGALELGRRHAGFLVPKNYENSKLYDSKINHYVIETILDEKDIMKLHPEWWNRTFEEMYGKVGTYEEMTRFIEHDENGSKIKKGNILNFDWKNLNFTYLDFQTASYLLSGIILLLWIWVIRNFTVIIMRFVNCIRHPAIRNIYDLQSLFDDFNSGYIKKNFGAYWSENWVMERKFSKICISKIRKIPNYQYSEPYKGQGDKK